MEFTTRVNLAGQLKVGQHLNRYIDSTIFEHYSSFEYKALKKEKEGSSVSLNELLEKANFQPQGNDTHRTTLTRESSGTTSMEQTLKGMRDQIEFMQKALEKRQELAPSLPIKAAPKVTLMGRSQPKVQSLIFRKMVFIISNN